MGRVFDKLLKPRVIGALVTCGAVLGIASLIHPTDTVAVPTTWDRLEQDIREQGVSLGSLQGRGFEAELLAGTPEAQVRLADESMTLEEFLSREYQLVPDQEGFSGDAWPEALMEVDVPADPW